MELFAYYMSAYMYELENCLNERKTQFKDINFQYDEANTDKEVKLLIKDIMLKNATEISQTESVEIDGNTVPIEKDKFKILSIKVPEEYTEEEKLYVKSIKEGVYVNPDLIIKIKFFDKEVTECFEIKSTKSNNIPGSSIQQIVPDEWVIFIKHTSQDITIVTGKYKNTINGTIQFPDRSPRPQVSFSTLKDWNDGYRVFDGSTLKYSRDDKENNKESLLSDWQGFLSDRWLTVLSSGKKINGEAWFNNNIRKFAVKLIENYDKLTEEEKKIFLDKIKGNIE